MKLNSCLILFLILLKVSFGYGEEQAVEQEEQVEQVVQVEQYEYSDPNYTRLFLTPTAETLKRGRAYVGITEIVLFQYAYGLSDNSQVGVTVFPFYPTAGVVFKSELIHTRDDIFSFQFGGGMPLIMTGEFSGAGMIGGFIYTRGNRDDRFTIGTNFFGIITNNEDNLVGALLNFGYEVRTSERVKWLFELALTPAFVGGEFANDFPRGITIGPRFFGRNFASDLGFFFPLQTFKGSVTYYAIPVINFAYHF